MQRKLLAVGAAWALLAVSAGPAVASGGDGGLVGAAQSAANVVTQDASATAETTQLVPVNANVPVAVASPGAGGDVEQSNDASSAAAAVNAAAVDQSAAQDAGAANGGGGGGGQQASNGVEQDAAAAAETVQVVPVNANAPLAEPSTGGADGCGCQPQPKAKAKHEQPAEDRSAGGVEQSNDASSSAAAGNVAIVEQTVEQTAPAGGGQPPAQHDDKQNDKQDGREPGKDRGAEGGQSATNEVDQDADAHAKTVQMVPVNVNAPIAIASPGAGGDVDQSNDASSKAGAGNVAIVGQDVDQTQSGSKGGDKPHGCGCDNKGDQGREPGKDRGGEGGQSATNEVDQDADAHATTVQIVPVNVNAPIAIASPGAGGDVDQSNDASSKAGAGNVAIVHQDIDQTSKGQRPHKPEHPGCACNDKGRKGQDGDKPRRTDGGGQRATNTVDQDATAHAKTVQLVPVNLNAPLSQGRPSTDDPGCGCNGRGKDGKGKGKPHARRGGDVSQSNRAGSSAGAGNLAVVGQDIDQTGNGNGSQTAINKVDQDANARAKTVQLLPINANLPSSTGSAPAPLVVPEDPGCGCGGTGPKDGGPWRGGGDVDQANTATSGAGALNLAVVAQSITQRGR